ncbi:protein-tyrosine phosphatase 2 [Purpureocillium lavendulum]|uniref:Protein-tyrosine phosphatase 2 n=1 Tax=Purpureocillium lavendulum TaxID=1247861 RepID=A0AB34FQN7_9HYPO|nr:protein-tyrosine phosphatase 2 [Purpureocillium lavendulum]
MDKIPRLRRKPKPPAIETSVDRTSRDSTGSANSDAEGPQHHHHHHHHHGLSPVVAAALSHNPLHRSGSASPAKKSPLRNLKIRASAKRARGVSPADHAASSPVAAVFSQDGVAPHASASRPANNGRSDANGHRARPEMPGFLSQSTQEIDRKFQEITWAERIRVADALRNQDVDDYKWGHYPHYDAYQRSMDRYSNIRPWNYNRVKLKVGEDEYDYVNASAITLASPSDESLAPLRYIAMQGPTEPSFDCVWRMIAEQMPSPAVIIQLTTMSENGCIKCHQYFPDSEEESTWTLNEADGWGDGWTAQLTYTSLQRVDGGAIEIRKLLLDVEGENETRVVWHFLYRQWPDFGVPTFDDMDSFYKVMKLSREYCAPSSPRIVHCSAGVGRTGTFICLEHLMRELELGAFDKYDPSTKSADPIFDTVELLRQQRRSMVQSDTQYHFIYTVMRKLWRERHGIPEDDGYDGRGEPAAKRLEVADPFTDNGDDAKRSSSSAGSSPGAPR